MKNSRRQRFLSFEVNSNPYGQTMNPSNKDEPSAKRARSEVKAGTTQLTFSSAAPLTSVVHAITNLSNQVAVRVSDGYITSQAVAGSKSCMVNAKLYCDISGPRECTFSVDSRTLLRAVKSINGNNYVVKIECGSDEDHITLGAIDDVTGTRAMEWKIPTLVSDVFSVELDKIDYCGEWLYDAKTLKSDIVRCREMDCDDTVTLRLLREVKTDQDDEQAGGKRVELHASGSRGSVCIKHCSTVTQTEFGQTATDGANESIDADCAVNSEVEYEQQYCVSNMAEFLRCTDSPSVKLLLGHEQPLIVEVPLVGDGSQMCFVQGPHADE